MGDFHRDSLLSDDLDQQTVAKAKGTGISPDGDKWYNKYHWAVRISSTLLMALTIVLSYLLGSRNGTISNQYSLYTTPPGIFFAIWGVIFTSMMITSLINLYYNIWTIQVHAYLAVVNCMLPLWSVVFDIGTDASVFIASAILMSIVPITLKLWIEMGKGMGLNWFVIMSRNVYAFFLGWIIAAANLSLGIWIKYWWGGSNEVQLIVFWVVAPLCAVGGTILNYSL